MIFYSWWEKFCWEREVKQISKKRAKGIRLTQEDWNTLAKPYLRQAIEDVRKNCPYEKMINEKEKINGS